MSQDGGEVAHKFGRGIVARFKVTNTIGKTFFTYFQGTEKSFVTVGITCGKLLL